MSWLWRTLEAKEVRVALLRGLVAVVLTKRTNLTYLRFWSCVQESEPGVRDVG